MEKDFRKEFDKLRPKIRKQWTIIFIIIIGFWPILLLIKYLFNLTDVPHGEYFGYAYALSFSCASLWLLRIKCPNCNKSLYVYKYIWKIPFIVQGKITNHCQHCGVWLKKERRGQVYS